MDEMAFTPIAGATHETAEPVDDPTPVPSAPSSTDQAIPTTSSKQPRGASTSSLPATKKLQPKRPASTSSSPIPSRETSPVRNLLLKSIPLPPRPSGPGRPRTNGSQEVSPSRSSSTNPTNTNTNTPSAAATQRALAAVPIPNLIPVVATEPTIRAPVPQKATVTSESREVPRWPISPRLRSPPPVNKVITSPRKTEFDLPAINVQRIPQSPDQQEAKWVATDSESDDSLLLPGMRTPVRGASGGTSTLETVQEMSQPSTPALGLDGVLEKNETGLSRFISEQDNIVDNAFGKVLKTKQTLGANESGSESGGKGEMKLRNSSVAPPPALRPSGPLTKSYSANAAVGRGKPSGEGSARNMTVETETVSSIPQVAVGAGPGGPGNNGSIRTKPSSETIRPKKEKKKNTRKAPSVTSGTGEHSSYQSRPRLHHHHPSAPKPITDATSARSPERAYGQGPYSPYSSSAATSPERPPTSMSRRPSLNLSIVSSLLTRSRPASSKADIFEAKVASAVDEANSSDSEETFVYESNPPEANDRPRRFHSRTPSATSMASQVDQRSGTRSMMDGGHSVAMKKSMKFANSYSTTNGPEVATGEDDGKGTTRSNMGTGRGTTHHHHIGRWGRNGGNGHQSLFDNESPFPNATKSKAGGNTPRLSSRPTSPRVANTMRFAGNGKKSSPIMSSGYDMDDGSDDEQTPLVSTSRSARSGRSRRPAASSMRQLERQASRQNPSFLNRFAGCLVLAVMIVLVISGAVGFIFATSQPLLEVKVLALKNVLVSEQELILDMKVSARNPNLVVVTIDSADIVVFAKSKYAGTDSEWWNRPSRRDIRRRGRKNKRDDDPGDPPFDDDPDVSPNLEIGHIYELDSALTFEGSPFQSSHSTSVGEIRVNNPGNSTTPSGSERWGRVLQHEFDLIVRGTLIYTLPLGQKVRKVGVDGRVTVKPNAAEQDPDNVHIGQRSVT